MSIYVIYILTISLLIGIIWLLFKWKPQNISLLTLFVGILLGIFLYFYHSPLLAGVVVGICVFLSLISHFSIFQKKQDSI